MKGANCIWKIYAFNEA